MSAFDWIESKAVSRGVERLVVAASDTDNAEDVGEYQVETKRFCGRVSYRMAKELRGSKPANTSETTFTLIVCMKTNMVEFFRTDYRKVAS